MAGSEQAPLLQGPGSGAGRWGQVAVALVYMGVGLLLVATYAWGIITLNSSYGTGMKLWGRLRDPGNAWLLYLYYFSISLATASFFPATWLALSLAPKLSWEALRRVLGFFLGFYISEMAWMPMCVAYIAQPRGILYILIRAQLILSGVLAICWAVSVLTLPRDPETGWRSKVAGYAGTFYFAFHCAVLDAIVWPPYFEQ